MDKRKKVWTYIAGAAIALLVLLVLISYVSNRKYSSKIPELQEPTTLSGPLKNQIATALKQARRKPSADHLGELGMVYHSSANYDQASLCYELAIEKKPSAWKWQYYLGYLNMEMGNSDEVIANFKTVLEAKPENSLAQYYLGEAYMNLGAYKQAEELFLPILSRSVNPFTPGDVPRTDHFPIGTYARYQLSRIYADTQHTGKAKKTLQELIQVHPNYGPAFRLLGNIFDAEGNPDLGQQYRARANDLPSNLSPVDHLVDQLSLISRSELFLLKKIDEAVNHIYPDWALMLVDTGLQHMQDNKFLLSKAIKISLWLDLSEQAISYTAKHINSFKESYSEMYDMGMSFYHDDLYTQTIQYLSIALELNPLEAHIQQILAISFWKLGDGEKAQFLLDGLLERNLDNPDVLADVADIYMFDFNDAEKAIPLLNLLYRQDPRHPKVSKLSARLAEGRGKTRDAIRLYEESFSADPMDLTTIKKLGNLYVGQLMWASSIKLFQKALIHHPNDPYFLERLGTLLITCPDSSLTDLPTGKVYAERAFLHASSPAITKISAGRTLAYAKAISGDLNHAIAVLKSTIELAKRENFSENRISALEQMLTQFQSSSR